jgi:ELWxxDGT repeat protein
VGRSSTSRPTTFGPIRKTARPGGGNTFGMRFGGRNRAAASDPKLLVAVRVDACTLADDFVELPLESDSSEVELDVNFVDSFSDNLAGNTFSLAFAVDAGDGASEFTTITQTAMPNSTALRLVKDIRPGPDSSSPFLFNEFREQSLNGVLFFSANDGVSGEELWRTDGTEAGTFLLVDLDPGEDGSFPGEFTRLGDVVYFSVTSIQGSSCQLWKTDGTVAATQMVVVAADLDPDAFCINDLTSFQGALFFTINFLDGRDLQLWRTTGTAATTAPFAGVTIANDFRETAIVVVDNLLFFEATDPAHGDELWRSDDRGTELWQSDGTSDGTGRVRDLFPGAAGGGSGSGYGVKLDNRIFFTADDGIHGFELWTLAEAP